jgi:hypothetical protein
MLDTPSPNQQGSSLVSARCLKICSIGPGKSPSNLTDFAVVIWAFQFIGVSPSVSVSQYPRRRWLVATTPFQRIPPNAPELPEMPQLIVRGPKNL